MADPNRVLYGILGMVVLIAVAMIATMVIVAVSFAREGTSTAPTSTTSTTTPPTSTAVYAGKQPKSRAMPAISTAISTAPRGSTIFSRARRRATPQQQQQRAPSCNAPPPARPPPAPRAVNVPPSTPASRIVRSSSRKAMRTTPSAAKDAPMGRLFMVAGQQRTRLLPDVSEPILDVAPFGDGLLILLAYGNMIYVTEENGNLIEYHLVAANNVVPTMIVPFDGTVIAVTESGRLFEFEFVNEDDYQWVPFLEQLSGVSYINSPACGSLLWAQTPSVGYLFNGDLTMLEQKPFDYDYIRVYGNSPGYYMDINRTAVTGTRNAPEENPKSMDAVYGGAWLDREFVKMSYGELPGRCPAYAQHR